MEDKNRNELLYIELPNLINRILRMTMPPIIKNNRATEVTIEEIKKK